MRYRAKPSFTVEVKRNNKRLPLTVTTGDSASYERYRRADQLLFGGSSPAVRSAARLDDGGLSTRTTDAARQPPAAEAVRSEPQAEATVAQRLTGRILPDLLTRISHTFCDTGAIWSERVSRCKSLSAAGQADPFRQSDFQPPAGRLMDIG